MENITASEARDLTRAAVLERNISAIKDLMNLFDNSVNKAASSGNWSIEFKTNVPKEILPIFNSKLVELGYCYEVVDDIYKVWWN